MPKKILIVDDEVSIIESLAGILADEGFLSVSAETGEQAVAIVEREKIDLVLMDVWMPGIDGLEALKRIKELQPQLPVIMISGHGTIDTAVQATKMGAFDFIEKPPSYDKILLAITNALHLSQIEKDNLILLQKTHAKPSLTGNSPIIANLKAQIERVGPTDAWVLIQGEHGTGKELVAQAIHRCSECRHRPMIEVNCAAIPEELIESELFGYEKGAFTGATSSKRGKFDLADGSTLFLDEIADMSLKTQAKILRILQEQKYERVGGSKTISVKVRVFAATNKDLEQEIEAGNFRADLYWRLNVVPIQVPPLRARLEDLPFFVEEFLRDFVQKGFDKTEFSPGALRAMARHSWPGNVRELRNFIERVKIMCPEPVISEELVVRLLGLPGTGAAPVAGEGLAPLWPPDLDFREARKQFERQYLQQKLAENNGNISKTAEAIGMERSHLHKKLKMLEMVAS